MSVRFPAVVVLVLLASWPALQARATELQDQDKNKRDDTFSIRVSGYLSEFDLTMEADGSTQAGTPVNLKHDLGLDDNKVVANVEFNWRPLEKHEFGLGYHTRDADKTSVIPAAFDFNGTHYDTLSTVHAAMDLDSYEAYYIWWAASHENWSLGPRVGLQWQNVKLRLVGQVDADGNPIHGIDDAVSIDVPTVTFGGSWRWTFAKDWKVTADAGYFLLDIDNVDGDVYFGRAGIEWFPWQRSGFVLDYTYNKTNVDVEQSRFHGSMNFIDQGVRLGYIYRF